MKKYLFKTQILLVLILTCCIGKSSKQDEASAHLYFNGDIITMEGKDISYAEAILEKNGQILFVGTKENALKIYGKLSSSTLC